jgi:hypothetical protein
MFQKNAATPDSSCVSQQDGERRRISTSHPWRRAFARSHVAPSIFRFGARGPSSVAVRLVDISRY